MIARIKSRPRPTPRPTPRATLLLESFVVLLDGVGVAAPVGPVVLVVVVVVFEPEGGLQLRTRVPFQIPLVEL